MVAVSASGPNTSSRADLVQSGTQPDSVLCSLNDPVLANSDSLSEALLFSSAFRSTPATYRDITNIPAGMMVPMQIVDVLQPPKQGCRNELGRRN